MPSTPVRYHTLVLGSGQGGTPFAVASAAAGYRTLLIENSHLGGCCVNIGCTPTKTLIASGRVAYLARRAGEYGIHFPGAPDGQVAVDMVAVRQRKREIVESFRGGSERRAAGAPGLDVWYGTAKFVGEKTMLVEPIPGNDPVKGGEKVTSARLVEAETIVLNVGERPARPSIQGLDNVPKDRILDSTSIQELDTVPGHLAVLGGMHEGALSCFPIIHHCFTSQGAMSVWNSRSFSDASDLLSPSFNMVDSFYPARTLTLLHV